MSNIKPSAERRHSYSIEAHERSAGRFELYTLLEKGLEDIKAGCLVDAEEVMDEILGDLRNGTL